MKLEGMIEKYKPSYETETYHDLKRFQRIYLDNGIDATVEDLIESIEFLTRLLYDFFNKRVFVLIDEYDLPINSFFYVNNKDCIKFVTSILSCMFRKSMKNNPYLQKGIMTGIFNMAYADLFSGLNNFAEYGVLDKTFSEYFGFTHEEVSNLLNDYQQKEEIKHFYNGYFMGGNNLYNP